MLSDKHLQVEQLQQRRDELYKLTRTFETDGWEIYQRDLGALYNVLKDNAVEECDTAEKWTARRAVMLNLQALSSYQANSEAELELVEHELTHPGESLDEDERNPLED